MKMAEIKKKIMAGERIDREEALALYDLDILELGALADRRRRWAVTYNRVGFIIDRIINYTNVCEARCAFCAYHARAGRMEPYELTMEDILEKVDELVQAGGLQVMLQGGLNPKFDLEKMARMVRSVKDRYPDIYLHSFSPAEVVYTAEREGLSFRQVVRTLKEAGVSSIPGASDLLVERIRREVSPNKMNVNQWIRVMEALAAEDMTSTATMTYGMGETIEERIEHLDVIRSVQDRLNLLRAFIPWSFSPVGTTLSHIPAATGMEYLKVVALARIYLDNVIHIQAGWLTEGLKLAQVALTMGASDMGGVLTEEVVVKATGVDTRTSMTELVDIISNAGFTPVLRDSSYQVIREF
jgi:cyclic dehypoxanthinyl futalosine synthase